MTFTYTYEGNVLYITPTGELPNNTQYSVHIEAGLSGVVLPSGTIDVMTADYDFWFTTKYCPAFSTANRVKLQVGPLTDSVIDDTIWRLIHKNSIDAIDLFNINNGSNVSYEYWGCDWQNVPLQIRRYVECKTAYDLLAIMRATNSLNGSLGNQSKHLGDMTIAYGGSTSAGKVGDPTRMKELYDCWNESIRTFKGIAVTVKALYDVSLGYSHPAMCYATNRVIKPVMPFQGNYTPGTIYWRGF